MKIVCDACQTKYSIADDRVAGKVFKIRCKKCSQIIVVRGAAATEPVDPPAEVAAGEWHVVIDGQQSGPFERAELVRRHAAGEIDDDTFVWRDGMEEWAAFGAVAELADGTSRTAPVEEPAPQEPMFSTRTVDAFASAAEVNTPAVEARSDADKKLLAERNENSVLFTLGNLAKLANEPRTAAKDTASKAGAGAAGGEGSGLIDIRALASTFAKPGAAKAATAIGSMDDLPTFGPTTFGEPIVLMPSPRQQTDRKMIYALFAALAMLAIVGAVLLVVLMRKDPEAQATKETPDTRVAALGNPAPVTDSPATTASPPPTPPSTPDAPAPVTTPATTTTTPAPAPTRPTTTRPATTRPTTTTRPTPTRPTTTTTTRPTTPATPTTPSTKPDRVQCEFSGFADKGCEIYKPATSTTTASNLPENLDRGAIAAGLGTIRAQACGGRSSSRGDVSVQIKVNANGGVSGVTVKSSPDPALSACVVAAAQKGTFAKTKRGASFGYVWRF